MGNKNAAAEADIAKESGFSGIRIYENAAAAADILKRGRFDDEEKAAAVRAIVADVRENGDAALFSYCKKFDGAELCAENIAVTREEIAAAYDALSAELLASMRRAAENILAYHSRGALTSARGGKIAVSSPDFGNITNSARRRARPLMKYMKNIERIRQFYPPFAD